MLQIAGQISDLLLSAFFLLYEFVCFHSFYFESFQENMNSINIGLALNSKEERLEHFSLPTPLNPHHQQKDIETQKRQVLQYISVPSLSMHT